jgi:hypothetical protein
LSDEARASLLRFLGSNLDLGIRSALSSGGATPRDAE